MTRLRPSPPRATRAPLLRALAIVLVTSVAPDARAEEVALAIGERLEAPLELIDARFARRAVGADDVETALVVVFLDVKCPAVDEALPELKSLAEELAERGVAFLGVDANDRTRPVEAAAYALDADLPFPVLVDLDQSAKARLGVARTPEVVVLDHEGALRYRGAVTASADGPTRAPLRDALKAVLGGARVAAAEVPSAGCLIRRPRATRGGRLSWDGEVGEIVRQRCAGCHRAGGGAPFALESREDALARLAAIAAAVDSTSMPPSLVDPQHGRFVTHRPLSAKERTLLLGWIRGGGAQEEAPGGDGGASQGSTSPTSPRGEEWMVAPDRVVALEKADESRRQLASAALAGELWVEALEIRVEGERRTAPLDLWAEPPEGSSEQPSFLGDLSPAGGVHELGAGRALRLVPGARLVLRATHGQELGRSARARVALRWPREVVRQRVRSVSLGSDQRSQRLGSTFFVTPVELRAVFARASGPVRALTLRADHDERHAVVLRVPAYRPELELPYVWEPGSMRTAAGTGFSIWAIDVEPEATDDEWSKLRSEVHLQYVLLEESLAVDVDPSTGRAR